MKNYEESNFLYLNIYIEDQKDYKTTCPIKEEIIEKKKHKEADEEK